MIKKQAIEGKFENINIPIKSSNNLSKVIKFGRFFIIFDNYLCFGFY